VRCDQPLQASIAVVALQLGQEASSRPGVGGMVQTLAKRHNRSFSLQRRGVLSRRFRQGFASGPLYCRFSDLPDAGAFSPAHTVFPAAY
jgi:hypothetical protein